MNGVIIINKPKGYTSHDVVNKMRKILNTKKVGHTGTLDPNATGVLPILIGDATKISKYLIEHDKTYIATIKLGERTTTGDGEGDIVEIQNVEVGVFESQQYIQQILESFIGKQTQLPPMYSAVKINGKKLYDYAKAGQEVERVPREIEIYSIRLLEIDVQNSKLVFEVSCSKGTYIRVLCEEIANKLGTIGYMKELVRTRVNEFRIEDSVTLEELESDSKIDMISIEEVFKDANRIELDNEKIPLFLNGVLLTCNLTDEVYKIYNENKFIGLGIVKNKFLKRDVVVKEVGIYE